MSYQKTTGTLMANSHPGSYCGQDAYNDMFVTEPQRERESMDVYDAKIRQLHGNKDSIHDECETVQVGNGFDSNEKSDYVVRRLTPTECARLQGFPDDWVWNIGIDNPTDEDITRWREVFYTYDMATKGTVKKRSDKVIAKFLKNPNSDSAEYKLWGNGIALPCIIPMMKAMYDCFVKE